jgi:proline iminopeptidase
MSGRVERVTVGDAGLWCETTGAGPGLVLAHGGPGMSDNLGPLAALVDHRFTVHRFDQRACGRSTGLGSGQTVSSAVADLEALREHWGHDRWIVGGHSWGALLALCYAVTHPRRTVAVLYVSGPGLTPPPERPAARSREDRLTAAERAELERLQAQPSRAPAAARRIAHLVWRTDFSDPGKAPDFARSPLFDHPRNAEAAAALRASADPLVRTGRLAADVSELDVPVLVLHGRDDPRPVESAVALADLLPRATLDVIDGVGHNPWLEDEAATSRALNAFLAGLAGQPGPPRAPARDL